MHWVFGRRRRQHESPIEAAQRTGAATRTAAAVALIAALLAVGGAIGAEIVDRDSSGPGSCTAVALTGYMYLYEDGTITHSEYESLRADAIEDELSDTGDCARGASL